MGRHNIQFKGLRHSPSDITGQDGDLLDCVNLIHDNGELKPIEMPERMNINGKLKNGLAVLVAVHNVTNGKKFVFALYDNGNTTISYKEENSNSEMTINTISGEQIQWAETIGNTLIIGTDKSTHYTLYKNGTYEWLGDKLPQPVFEFDLESGGNGIEYEGNPYLKDYKGNTMDGGGIPFYYRDDGSFDFVVDEQIYNSEENKRLFAENIKLKCANLMHKCRNNCRFVFPFFVRYALKMYDNNYVMHSAPVLMLPSTDKNPLLLAISYTGFFKVPGYDSDLQTSDVLLAYNTGIHYLNKRLKYKFLGFFIEGTNVTPDIKDWEGIVKGVDIFLSSQIVTYNEDFLSITDNINLKILKDSTVWNPNPDYVNPSTFDGGKSYAGDQSISIKDKLIVHPYTEEDWPAVDFLETEHITVQGDIYGFDFYARKSRYYPMPSYSSGEIREKIENTNLFYRVKSYDISEMTQTFSRYLDSEIEYGLLDRLETMPILPDDYVSRSRISGNTHYNYNQRLLIGNISVETPLWYMNTNYYGGSVVSVNDDIKLCFEIEKEEKTIHVYRGLWLNNSNLTMFGHYIYFPDKDCKRVYVEMRYDNNPSHIAKFVIPMKEHSGLNGSFALSRNLKSLYESKDLYAPFTHQIYGTSQDRYYSMPNTIAMSSVANPFHFPSSNFKDIGRAEVIGIAANTLDVSSGQWGQYPLYVFCSDGIIAVMIDGEGKFGGIQAVSADVLREPIGLSRPTLVQTGQMLMFLTRRGVMAIAGTKIQCVSEAMEGRHFNTIRELPDAGQNVGSFVSFIRESSDDTDFRDYAASAFLAYDYAHNRVLVIRPDRDYQYVYALKTGMWSKEIIYTNLANLQVSDMHLNDDKGFGGVVKPLQVKPIGAAVNNYTEMYLQDRDSWLYRTMGVAGENNTKQLYQYGYFVSRPIRFGTDEYKTITRLLHRYTHYAVGSNVKLALYGSRDGVRYGRINTLRGMSYQYFIFVIFTYLKPNERYSYVSVDFETRLTNKLR